MRVLGVCSCLLGVTLALSTGLQQSSEFARLLTAYRGLDAEQAVREFAGWPDARVLRDSDILEGDLWSMAAASLLHLEAGLAIAGFRRDDEGIQAGHFPAMHLQIGVALLERMIGVARRDGNKDILTFCRDWYLAFGTVPRSQWGVEGEVLQSTRKLLEGDPYVHLFYGASTASGIGPWRQGDGPYGVGNEYDLKGRRVSIITADGETYNADAVREAESALREAIGLDSSLVEAHVRLGRLLQLTNRKKAAEAEFSLALDPAVSPIGKPPDRFSQYLAALFLGKAHEDAGRLADAQTTYENAIERYPTGTVARLAVAQVLLLSGRERDSLSKTRSVFSAATRPPSRDPWVRFPVMSYGQVTERLAAMRLRVSKTPLAPRTAQVAAADLSMRNTDIGSSADPPTVLPADTRPVFRSTVDGVRIDALVTDGGRPVTGLSPADFVVTDTGRLQRITTAAVTGSLALAVVIDTSQSVSLSGAQAQMRHATEAVRTALLPNDLVSVVSASDRLALRADLIRGSDSLQELFAGIRAEPRSGTAIWDGTLAASALVADGPGRALVVVISDGYDNGSWFERREALNRLKRTGLSIDGIGVTPDSAALQDGRDIAFGDVSLRPLETVTGGVFFDANDPSLAAKLRERFATLRDSYLLMYTPSDVKPQKDGWHEIKVTLRPGLKGKVQARPGYYAPIGK